MDHAWLQERLFEFHDGQLAPAPKALVEEHLSACADCRTELAAWRRTAQAFVQPLRVEPSEAFVRGVMTGIRTLDEETATVQPFWPMRWAFPALTLSMAGFAAAFLYVAPAEGSADSWFSDEQEVSVTLLAQAPSEENILTAVVEP